jgi:hypothetical protein
MLLKCVLDLVEHPVCKYVHLTTSLTDNKICAQISHLLSIFEPGKIREQCRMLCNATLQRKCTVVHAKNESQSCRGYVL